MASVQNILDDIRDVFRILHDGVICEWSGDKEVLKLKIDCGYLAKRINKSYENFFVECYRVEKIELRNDLVQTGIADIFKNELTIASAEIEDDFVKISCSEGRLLLKCHVIKILDECKQPLTIVELDVICKAYWDEMSKQTEQEIIRKNPEKYT